MQPSDDWGTMDGYAFLWQAYQAQYDAAVLAVARPRHMIHAGETALLDATKSWAENGVKSYRWHLALDGEPEGVRISRTYNQQGRYSEVAEVMDNRGNADYDYTVVEVDDPESTEESPGIHAAYYPSFDVYPGDEVTFHVRVFGRENATAVWNFDDGSDTVSVKTNLSSDPHAEKGYGQLEHAFSSLGTYLVTVHHESEHGRSEATLEVVVREPDSDN